MLGYFTNNKISWWGGKVPTGHILSSQIACLNHLFAIRKDKDTVLAVAKKICEYIDDVLPIPTDTFLSGYIAFEVVSDNDLLKEGIPARGSNCTSIDALILAKHRNDNAVLIPIEWKYTEFYNNTDKSTEDGQGHQKGSQASGVVRLSRYSDFIDKSTQLKNRNALRLINNNAIYDYTSQCNYTGSIYFFEPFYQLMRQTLWAEQMIKHRSNESIKADDFIHVHVIPSENHDLLKYDLIINRRRKGYLKSDGNRDSLKNTWKSCLQNPSKYKIITPQDLLSKIDNKIYGDLIDYLSKRYW